MENKQAGLIFQHNTAFNELTLNRGSKLLKPAKSHCDSPLVGLHEIRHVWLQQSNRRQDYIER